MAAERRPSPSLSVIVHDDRPLLGVLEIENGRQSTRYFTEDDMPAEPAPDDVRTALSAIGAWNDLDWDQTKAALDRIRHASQPT